MVQLDQQIFEDFLSYHGWIMKKVLKSLISEDYSKSTRIKIKPEKIMTLGVFGKPTNVISFNFNN